MKLRLFLLCITLFSFASHAGLVIQRQVTGAGVTNRVTLRVQAGKTREDGQGMIVIHDMATFEQITLSPRDKMFSKISGEQVAAAIQKEKQSLGTNFVNGFSRVPTATGKTEKVGNYETEIYIWTNGRGISMTLWVARDYPGYATIRPHLARFDQFLSSGLDRFMTPDLAGLPGMVVKSTETYKTGASPQTVTIELISAKIEEIDKALFEVPSDYKDGKPKAFRGP